MTKLIIFDIGGVIEDFTEEQYIGYICKKLKLDRDKFGRELIAMLPAVESSRITTSEMLERLGRRFGVGAKRLEWAKSLGRLAKIDDKVADLVNKLNRRYRLVLLTNVSKSRYMENVRIGFFKRVRCGKVYASCYLKMIKPGARIYRYVLSREGVAAKDAIFVDNLFANVRGAEKVGIKGIQFTSYEKLVKDLKRLGIRW